MIENQGLQLIKREPTPVLYNVVLFYFSVDIIQEQQSSDWGEPCPKAKWSQ